MDAKLTENDMLRILEEARRHEGDIPAGDHLPYGTFYGSKRPFNFIDANIGLIHPLGTYLLGLRGPEEDALVPASLGGAGFKKREITPAISSISFFFSMRT